MSHTRETFRVALLLACCAGFATAALAQGLPVRQNGDVNGDNDRNLADPVYTLTHLFLGGPAPVAAGCPPEVQCADDLLTTLRNGDVNGDEKLDVADAVYELVWLFLGGKEPEPLCRCLEPRRCPEGCDEPARCVPDGPDSFVCTSALSECDGVQAVYEFLTGDYGVLCDGELECQVVFGHCGVGLGGCFYALSSRVDPADLDALAERFTALGCTGPVCRCIRPPESAVCAGIGCQFAGE
jgi:hypothetical protein